MMTKNSQDEIIIKLKSLSSMFTEVKRLLNDAAEFRRATADNEDLHLITLITDARFFCPTLLPYKISICPEF